MMVAFVSIDSTACSPRPFVRQLQQIQGRVSSELSRRTVGKDALIDLRLWVGADSRDVDKLCADALRCTGDL